MSGGRTSLFSGRRGSLFLIAGPCALEDDGLNFEVADHLATLARRFDLPVIFKGSFDKANRTSVGSARGPGLEAGLRALERVRERAGLPVLTDIHLPEQAGRAAAVVDGLQIPAFLCRQTDLLLAAGATGRPVNVKKGQWMAPGDMRGAAEKLRQAGAREVAVTERGVAFGYGRWIVDMRSFALMREATGCPTVLDASHAVQLPGGGGAAGDEAGVASPDAGEVAVADEVAGGGGGGDVSGGEPRHIGPLAAAAVAAGADGLFVEVHPDPGSAPSDGSNMLPLDQLERVLKTAVRVREAVGAA